MEIFILQDDLYANMRKERKKLNNPGLRLFRMRGQGTVDIGCGFHGLSSFLMKAVSVKTSRGCGEGYTERNVTTACCRKY